MVSCTIFSQWPPKGPKCRKSENRKSTMVIFFFEARPHVIWSFWSQIGQGITMWTPTRQFQHCILPPPANIASYIANIASYIAPQCHIHLRWFISLRKPNTRYNWQRQDDIVQLIVSATKTATPCRMQPVQRCQLWDAIVGANSIGAKEASSKGDSSDWRWPLFTSLPSCLGKLAGYYPVGSKLAGWL